MYKDTFWNKELLSIILTITAAYQILFTKCIFSWWLCISKNNKNGKNVIIYCRNMCLIMNCSGICNEQSGICSEQSLTTLPLCGYMCVCMCLHMIIFIHTCIYVHKLCLYVCLCMIFIWLQYMLVYYLLYLKIRNLFICLITDDNRRALSNSGRQAQVS